MTSQLLDNHAFTDETFFKGLGNRFIRWYFYINKGLQAFNEFRYLIMTIFGAYWLTKSNNLMLLFAMFAASLVILAFIGWLFVIKVNKITDYLNVHFSTVWSKHQIALQEESYRCLKRIADKVDQKRHPRVKPGQRVTT